MQRYEKYRKNCRCGKIKKVRENGNCTVYVVSASQITTLKINYATKERKVLEFDNLVKHDSSAFSL